MYVRVRIDGVVVAAASLSLSLSLLQVACAVNSVFNSDGVLTVVMPAMLLSLMLF